jgi:hypothetical protein
VSRWGFLWKEEPSQRTRRFGENAKALGELQEVIILFLKVFSRFIVYFADDLYNNEKKIGEFKGEPL